MTATDADLACPRCGQALGSAELRQVPVQVCKTCKGTLLGQIDLQRTLEGLSAPLLMNFDPDAKIEAVKDASGRLPCPKCNQAMDRDDYCQAGVVFFDRCARCALLWFDTDELGAMALMWARMNARAATLRFHNPAGPGFLVMDRTYLGHSVWDCLVFHSVW